MFQCLVNIREVILKLYLLCVSGNQPELQTIVSPGEIIIAEFETIVDTVNAEPLLHPFGKIPVHWFEIRNGKYTNVLSRRSQYKFYSPGISVRR